MRTTLTFLALLLAHVSGETPHVIRVTDAETDRLVPMVSLRTVHGLEWITDNSGCAAIDAPELFGEEVYFHVRSHGYEMKADGFGNRGKRIRVSEGGESQITIHRLNIAERIRRLTGAGRYAESAKAGLPVPEPLLASEITGCDSVQNAIFDNQLFWIWGDTSRLRYPLGNFKVTGALSDSPHKTDPEKPLNWRYFTNDSGFVRQMAPFDHRGPVWLTGLVTLHDASDKEHLVAVYEKIRGFLTTVETGLCEWDGKIQSFRELDLLPDPRQPCLRGHPCRFVDEGVEWLYAGSTFPTLRVRARYENWCDPSQRKPVRSDVKLVDRLTGKPVKPHNGHVAWNAYRKRYVAVFTASDTDPSAPSHLGEIYYAESKRPDGPWRKAVKILTHQRYTFYNPKQHPYFVRENGRYLYFEGTYANTFSRSAVKTPRYDYNQILYRLDLDDKRLQGER